MQPGSDVTFWSWFGTRITLIIPMSVSSSDSGNTNYFAKSQTLLRIEVFTKWYYTKCHMVAYLL